MVAVVVWLGLTVGGLASAQTYTDFAANPGSLGPIPDNSPGTPRDVTFTVTGVSQVTAARISITFNPPHTWVGDVTATLIAPDSTPHVLFERIGRVGTGSGDSSDLTGPYVFHDGAAGNLWDIAVATGGTSVIPPGEYRTIGAGANTPTFMNPAFVGRLGNGTWTLRLTDSGLGDPGSVSAATLSLESSFDATPGTLGAIPDRGVAGCGPPAGPPKDVAFTVSNLAGTVTGVGLSMTIAHTWAGDVHATLIAPGGTSHVLFGNVGATTPSGCGSANDFAGTYVFNDAAATNLWATGNPIPPGNYRTSTPGLVPSGGALTLMSPVFAGLFPNGTWTLRLTDSGGGEAGTISAASLAISVTGIPPPAGTADAYSTPFQTMLSVLAPGVLGNDTNPAGGGARTAVVATLPTRGTLALASDGGFTYTPLAGVVGPDSFTYRPVNVGGGPGNLTTVSLTVDQPTSPQSSTLLRVDEVSGNQVRLRWTAPTIGPMPTGYLLEGGVNPGQVLGSVATGHPYPVLTFTAPSGSFFVRVRTISGADVSGPSNEVPLHVNVPRAPSAPAGLAGLVNGDTLALSWTNTFGGGAPTGLLLDVTGSVVGAIPMGLAETFSFAGVPGGSYTFQVRANNAGGVSAPSNAVSLAFPNGCTGTPAVPANFLFFKIGSTVFLYWDPPVGGPASTGYVLNVTGSFVGAVPVAGRSLSAAVPPGSYSVSVTAINACGASPATAVQTVTVP